MTSSEIINNIVDSIYTSTMRHFNEMATTEDSELVRRLISAIDKSHPSIAWQRILFQMGNFIAQSMIIDMKNMNAGYRDEIGVTLLSSLVKTYAEIAAEVFVGEPEQIVRQLELGFAEELRRAVSASSSISAIGFTDKNNLLKPYTNDEIENLDLSDNLAGVSSVLICDIAKEVVELDQKAEYYINVAVAFSLLELYIKFTAIKNNPSHFILKNYK